MATRQSASKPAKPVTASPTNKSPASKPQRTRPAPAPKPAATPIATAGTPATDAGPASMVGRVLGPVLSAVASALRSVVDWCGGGLPFATFVFSVLGLADAVYLAIDHFSNAKTFPGCPENSTFNCLAVTTSPWSRIPAGTSGGIPVAVLGLAFFVFMLAINSRWGWRAPWAAAHWARLASVIVGIVFVLYLVWAELFRINHICLYCTGVHIITFILFALIISRVVMSGVSSDGTTDHG